MRRSLVLVSRLAALSAVAAAVGCGTGGPTPAATPAPDAWGGPVVGRGLVMQTSAASRVELCLGPVATSYPPQCSGPGLRGAFSWEDLEVTAQEGQRWTDQTYYAVGTFDRDADMLTLTRPLSEEPPAGLAPSGRPDVEAFPQLCDDPFRGGDPGYSEDLATQERLQRHLETMDGYVGAWVSDGVDLFNVVVTGDPEAAHTALRELWPGGLCVVQRDVPTAEDVASAQDAVSRHAEEIGLLSCAGLVSGTLEVEVLLADPATTRRVHELVRPWLSPEFVLLTAALVPLQGQ